MSPNQATSSGAQQSGGAQFDLTVVDNTELDQLAADIEGYYKKDTTQKTQLSFHWERASLFLDGKQWLVFSNNASTGGMWTRLETTKHNDYIPRPTTNYLFDCYQTLKSYLIKTKPRSTVYPNT